MRELTIAEQKWIKKVEKLLNNPPSSRIAAYTTDGSILSFYDKDVLEKWRNEQSKIVLDRMSAVSWYSESNSNLIGIKVGFPLELLSW